MTPATITKGERFISLTSTETAGKQDVHEDGEKASISVLVAIPCYNEEVAVGSIVLRALRYSDQVLVIDDGSSDNTAEVARLAGASVIRHSSNMGKGASIKDAFKYAVDSGSDVLVLIDGDGQHNPDEIPFLIRPIIDGEADMVNGSRFISDKNNVPKYRRVGQKVLNFATNAGSRLNVTDSQNGYRAFGKASFRSFSFTNSGMAIESEMLMDAAAASLRIKEVPVDVRYDVDGSTQNPVTHGVGVLNTVLGLISQRRPLLFFGVPGLITLTLGFWFSVQVLNDFNRTTVVATGTALISMLCIIVGVLSMFTGFTLMSIQSIRSMLSSRPRP